ncbi:MAG: 6-bladed beta-propeller [Bacteroidales bacterium]|nr:6-bladed beta-propeller [Bacteroidales bacterium]
MKKCLLLACAILAVSACAPKSTELKIYDLDAVGFEVTVKMSDIADNLRVVPLESGDDFIVSSETQKWVNDKYILIFGQNAIEQFSAEDGKHIRTLAVKGGGPN